MPESPLSSPTADRGAPILAFDTASPTVSLAVGSAGRVAATRSLDLRQSSERLLRSIGELLEEAGLRLADLRGVVALQGPGSFTGLRIGLATALGLHQALGLDATALPTLPVLARAAAGRCRDGDVLIAAVDALRGDWMAQTFTLEGGEPQGLDRPSLRSAAEIAASGLRVVAFEVDKLGLASAAHGLEATPLAPLALAAARRARWEPAALVQPIYFRPPAARPLRQAQPATSAGG
jgi:tRNA threonylcarbamoyl adenosine modification protein YeaZ